MTRGSRLEKWKALAGSDIFLRKFSKSLNLKVVAFSLPHMFIFLFPPPFSGSNLGEGKMNMNQLWVEKSSFD